MYKNLLAEIARSGRKREEVAKAAGMGAATLSEKINGKRSFKLEEAFSLRTALGCEHMTIDELFEKTETEE